MRTGLVSSWRCDDFLGTRPSAVVRFESGRHDVGVSSGTCSGILPAPIRGATGRILRGSIPAPTPLDWWSDDSGHSHARIDCRVDVAATEHRFCHIRIAALVNSCALHRSCDLNSSACGASSIGGGRLNQPHVEYGGRICRGSHCGRTRSHGRATCVHCRCGYAYRIFRLVSEDSHRAWWWFCLTERAGLAKGHCATSKP